jgi:hypothetical protein
MVGDENRRPAMHQFALEAMVPEVMGSVSVDCHLIGSVRKTEKERDDTYQKTRRHRATG